MNCNFSQPTDDQIKGSQSGNAHVVQRTTFELMKNLKNFLTPKQVKVTPQKPISFTLFPLTKAQGILLSPQQSPLIRALPYRITIDPDYSPILATLKSM